LGQFGALLPKDLAVSRPDIEEPRPRRLVNFTPLRYPGGKGKLASYIKRLISTNRLLDGEYVEPFAGGAAIALELLFHEYVSKVHINDLSRPVYAFWHSVLNRTDDLCRLIRDTPRTVGAWDRQKLILAREGDHDLLDVGFSMFFLNRTNRSGILNGGIIGGRDQTGPWKIDARYNADELVYRIECIARLKKKISVTKLDALKFLTSGAKKWPSNTLIYCDPPYYIKGKDLYYHFYKHEDHERIAMFVQDRIVKQRWVVSYDNVPQIRDLYDGCQRAIYGIGYSARGSRTGSEVMFFSDKLSVPPLVGAVTPIEEQRRLL
jgi:DNA adenine methylase